MGVIEGGAFMEFAIYICRACGAEIAYPQRFVRCPDCGIRLN